MEPFFARGVVLRCAGIAHRKDFHGSLRPVVGNCFDDSKARAAVGAVDEGVVEPSVVGVEQFAQAIVTKGDIRWNCRVGRDAGYAWQN